MLVLETVAKIRRAYFVQKKTIKAICRELRVSRKVVRKVLRSEATEFHYERGEQRLPRIGPWQAALDQMLASSEAKPGRERLTLIRIFEALRGLGYEGGYDAARRYARVWQRDRAARVGAFIPLSFRRQLVIHPDARRARPSRSRLACRRRRTVPGINRTIHAMAGSPSRRHRTLLAQQAGGGNRMPAPAARNGTADEHSPYPRFGSLLSLVEAFP